MIYYNNSDPERKQSFSRCCSIKWLRGTNLADLGPDFYFLGYDNRLYSAPHFSSLFGTLDSVILPTFASKTMYYVHNFVDFLMIKEFIIWFFNLSIKQKIFTF